MAYVTIRDVAAKAGVSAAAVSQILRGKGRFSAETRDLVKRTVDELGYVPDRRASAMRSSSSKTVGLLVPDLRNPYFADLVSSMEDELYRRGYTTLIGTSAERVDRQDAFIDTLLGQRIDGALVVPQGACSPGIRSLVARGLPVVFVDRRVEGAGEVPFVVSDPYPGMREALRELVRLGHRRIGYVAHSSLGSAGVDERGKAFRLVAGELPGIGACVVVDCDATYESSVAALARLREAGVTAIVCGYSPDAIVLIGMCRAEGMEIGRDMSVVSFDDIATFRLMTPPVSVISQQAEEMGRRGVRILLSAIGDAGAAGTGADAADGTDVGESDATAGTAGITSVDGVAHYVPTTFIPRGSVGPVM
ncbi:substrate-binding domain-containing protein [Bifidobacterium platyrrhinorum]|uniref:LacI family DNA-binding transcriptional regulator n=1 Tax=Bifidobacterium platyrrhinorum TaxID=2661628 RepID=A0A6L9SNV7_9BIFI|nr:substrate-binding domain-containing protein [Bifidobacterium platyrrhinorum]NEG54216.1 LacI family DNA-binding transcriptional regulator [Bifidobacterium platyrrhinorum]